MAQLLNSIIVWMVLYCEHPLLGVNKKTKPFLHLSLGNAGPFTLESHSCVKALKCKVSQIIRCLIKPFLKLIDQKNVEGGAKKSASYRVSSNCFGGGALTLIRGTHYNRYHLSKPP